MPRPGPLVTASLATALGLLTGVGASAAAGRDATGTSRLAVAPGPATATAAPATTRPVVYLADAADGSSRVHVVGDDGRNDRTLGPDVVAATVSPDGRRLALLLRRGSDPVDGRTRTALVVTGPDGRGSVRLLSGLPGRSVLKGRPVFSPDGLEVAVHRSPLELGEPTGETRPVVCVVATADCRERPGPGLAGRPASLSAWTADAGPVVTVTGRPTTLRRAIRCGAAAVSVPGPAVRVRGLVGSVSGPGLTLRGLPSEGFEGAPPAPDTVGVVAVREGLLALDRPRASVRRGPLRCRAGREARVSLRTSIGPARLRLRSAGRTVELPTPSGLLRGVGLRLVGTADGGALLVSGVPQGIRGVGVCPAGSGRRVRACDLDLGFGGLHDAPTPRVWRWTPGSAPRFVRVRTIGDAALEALRTYGPWGPAGFAAAAGDAVVVLDGRELRRVPLDGGAPRTIARGAGLSLDVDR